MGLGLPELAEVCRPAWRVGVATHVAGSSTCAPRVPRPTATQTPPLIFPSEGDPRAGRVDDERDPSGGIWWGEGDRASSLWRNRGHYGRLFGGD